MFRLRLGAQRRLGGRLTFHLGLKDEPEKGISEGGGSICEGTGVEKELRVFVSRPVWLEHRERC